MRLELRPVTLRDARRFIGEHHRHNLPPRGWLFGVSVWSAGEMVGVGVAGRPVAREIPALTLEITRTCTIGTPNACSMIYGALARAGKALGYHKVITYTLASEDGASLKAAGFVVEAVLPGRPSWDYTGQARMQVDLFGDDRRPPDAKLRWGRELSHPGTR